MGHQLVQQTNRICFVRWFTTIGVRIVVHLMDFSCANNQKCPMQTTTGKWVCVCTLIGGNQSGYTDEQSNNVFSASSSASSFCHKLCLPNTQTSIIVEHSLIKTTNSKTKMFSHCPILFSPYSTNMGHTLNLIRILFLFPSFENCLLLFGVCNEYVQ